MTAIIVSFDTKKRIESVSIVFLKTSVLIRVRSRNGMSQSRDEMLIHFNISPFYSERTLMT